METTFHGLEFLTAPGRVFTPRATTEALVDAALAHIDERPLRIADVGTGSGVIGVSIAVAAPQVEVFATDINADAVALARENAERHGVARPRPRVRGRPARHPSRARSTSSWRTCRTSPEYERRPERHLDEPPEVDLRTRRRPRAAAPAGRHRQGGKLVMPGFVVVQYRGDVVEADCQHLQELREDLARHATTA